MRLRQEIEIEREENQIILKKKHAKAQSTIQEKPVKIIEILKNTPNKIHKEEAACDFLIYNPNLKSSNNTH